MVSIKASFTSFKKLNAEVEAISCAIEPHIETQSLRLCPDSAALMIIKGGSFYNSEQLLDRNYIKY